MSIKNTLRRGTPESIKQVIRPIRNLFRHFISKYDSELSFWKSTLDGHGRFHNDHYERLMLGIAGESNDSFLKGKIVADFGCGPAGSLVWAKSALLRIGIDVLADQYADAFSDNIVSHETIYLKSTEKVIPLPSGFLDVMFTVNAMDHVDNFSNMCREVLRVLKPGGEFIGSFNLEEPPTPSEPQRLTPKIIEENLIQHLEVQSCRIGQQGPEENSYAPFFDGNLSYKPGETGFLWVRGRKKI